MRTKENKGVTLIALAVTVIVLLIISGVTISYMTGENGIINQSKESKKFAGTVEEKEVLNTSVAAAVGKSSKSKVEENNLKKYLNQNVGDEVKDYTLEKRDGYYSVTFTATGNEYAVWENGTVQDMDEYQKTPYLKLDPNELNALETGSNQVIKAITNVNNPSIKWETSNSNIVTIQKKSNTEITVTGKSNGSAVITAKMDKLETKCQVTVITSPKEIILSNTEITIDLSSGNKTVQITPTITPDSANKNIIWTSSNTSIARVDEFGTITGISNGEATVTAKTVNGLNKICKVKVVTSPTAISLNKTNAVIDTTTSKNMQLTAVITPASANIYTGITWTSSNDNVVQVNQQGLVKGISNGLATVTAKTENGCTAQCRIVVGATIAGINLAPSNSAIEIEEKLQINATIEPNTSEETLIWVSSNSKVATVDQNGLVTGKSHGTVTITATGRDSMVANSVKVTVQTAPKSVALNITNKTIDLSSNERIFQLVGTISPSTANVYTHLKYTSSDKTVADVDENTGRVTALKNGTATITATTQNGKSASCTVTVTTAITSLTVSPTSKTLKTGETVQLTATKNPSTATEGITWTSSNSSVATVDQNGLVIAKGSGTATITVKSSTGGKSATCTITVEAGIAPVDPDNATDVTFSTEYGRIDIIWLDNSNNVISTPNMPILTSNGESMTPIIWNNEYKVVETTSTNSEWYDYSQKKWANAITANGSYFVWIPRYAYRITYYSDSNYENVTGYYDGYGQWCATTKKLRYKIEDGIKTKEYNGMKYIVHPAFCSDVNYGGFGKEISGFWVAKFKVSANEHDALGNMYGLTGDLQSVPGVWIGFKQTPGGFYKIARNATFGYTGEKDPIDGYTSYMNSHMAKNSEWGAIVYLTHSKFGKDGVNNISKGLKLYSGGENSGYSKYGWKRNISISTTGNVYGIYDMNQEVNENVAVFAEEIDKRNIKNYGWTELNKSLESTKYATKYKNPNKAKQGNKTLFNYSITGDAIKEINTGGIDSILSESYHGNWFSMMKFVYNSWPFSYRTGFYGVSNDNGSGAVVQNFRDILVP